MIESDWPVDFGTSAVFSEITFFMRRSSCIRARCCRVWCQLHDVALRHVSQQNRCGLAIDGWPWNCPTATVYRRLTAGLRCWLPQPCWAGADFAPVWDRWPVVDGRRFHPWMGSKIDDWRSLLCGRNGKDLYSVFILYSRTQQQTWPNRPSSHENGTESTLLVRITQFTFDEITINDHSPLLEFEIRTDIAISVLNSSNLAPKISWKIAQDGFHDLSASMVREQ